MNEMRHQRGCAEYTSSSESLSQNIDGVRWPKIQHTTISTPTSRVASLRKYHNRLKAIFLSCIRVLLTVIKKQFMWFPRQGFPGKLRLLPWQSLTVDNFFNYSQGPRISEPHRSLLDAMIFAQKRKIKIWQQCKGAGRHGAGRGTRGNRSRGGHVWRRLNYITCARTFALRGSDGWCHFSRRTQGLPPNQGPAGLADKKPPARIKTTN